MTGQPRGYCRSSLLPLPEMSAQDGPTPIAQNDNANGPTWAFKKE